MELKYYKCLGFLIVFVGITMAYIKFDFDLPGSLGKKENMKEHLIMLDASNKIFSFFKEKYIFSTKFQTEFIKRY